MIRNIEKLRKLQMIAEDCAAVIERHLGDVSVYLSETSSVPFEQPADAAMTVCADLHDMMVTLGSDFKENGDSRLCDTFCIRWDDLQ